jgi:hypothetical protein
MRSRRHLTRAAAALAAIAGALSLTIAGSETSGANFNATRANPTNGFSAAAMESYLRLYGQGSDPDGLTGYAVRNASAPAVPAATGVDRTLTAHLGGYDNVTNVDVYRVFTIKTPATLPVASVTVTITLQPDAGSGAQPINQLYFSTVGSTANAGAAVTLTAGQKRQVNLRVRTKSLSAGVLYAPAVRVTATFPGYAGTFFSYDVTIKVYDGPGAGPP